MSRSSSNEPAWRGPSLPTPSLQHPRFPHCPSSVPCATPLWGWLSKAGGAGRNPGVKQRLGCL